MCNLLHAIILACGYLYNCCMQCAAFLCNNCKLFNVVENIHEAKVLQA